MVPTEERHIMINPTTARLLVAINLVYLQLCVRIVGPDENRRVLKNTQIRYQKSNDTCSIALRGEQNMVMEIINHLLESLAWQNITLSTAILVLA